MYKFCRWHNEYVNHKALVDCQSLRGRFDNVIPPFYQREHFLEATFYAPPEFGLANNAITVFIYYLD